MKAEAFRYFTDGHITLIGMFLFLTVFVGVLFFTFHKDRKWIFDQSEILPLEEGGHNE